MSKGLNVAIDWKSLSSTPGSFTLITEAGMSDAGFLLSYSLSEHLNRSFRDGTPTIACLVTIAETPKHYHHVGLKLGVNLNKCLERGRLIVVDGIDSTNQLLDAMAAEWENEADEKTEEFRLPCLFNVDANKKEQRDRLYYLYAQIKSSINKIQSTNLTAKCLLVIDDLSLLLSIGFSVKEIVCFMEYCRCLVTSVGASMIARAYGSIRKNGIVDDDDDEQMVTLCRFLAHRSDAIIGVAHLATGYSKDVNGEMIVLYRKSRNPSNVDDDASGNSAMRWHYKVEDKRVIVFPPGLSSAVL